MASTMTVTCPACDTPFPVDPFKIPEGGARTRCTVCETQFRVDREPVEQAPDSNFEEMGGGVLEPAVPDPEDRVPFHGDMVLDEASGDVEDESGDVWDGMAGDIVDEPSEWEQPAPEEEAEAISDTWDDATWVWETDDETSPTDEGEEEEEPAAEEDESFASFMGVDEVVLPALESEDEAEVAGEEAPSGEPEIYGDVVADEPAIHEVGADEPAIHEVEADDEPRFHEVEAAAGAAGTAEAAEEGFQFGRRNPDEKARRLARVLVSDMITYNPERHARALENDSIEEDFEEEIRKSWAEYVEQVGTELAESTDYWRNALNEILARGKPLF